MNQMISALTLHNSYLVAASGSCKGVSGNISYCKIDESIASEKIYWHTCQSEQKASSYLDLSVINMFYIQLQRKIRRVLVVCAVCFLKKVLLQYVIQLKGTDGALLIKKRVM